MPSRLWRAAAILAPALLLAGLGAAGTATAATTSAPTLITKNFACSNGTCEVGPGNVGVPFGAALNGTGGPPTSLPDCPYITSVVSGSLAPGLQLGGVCGNIVEGTPTQAGTYAFTVQVTSLGSDTLGVTEPSGTQQLTITIGTGRSDRLANVSANWNLHTGRLSAGGYDANAGALYSLSLTATGKQLIAPQSMAESAGGNVVLTISQGTPDPCSVLHVNSCSLTITDSLGTSVTVTLPPPKY
jgi:hypothetical protein